MLASVSDQIADTFCGQKIMTQETITIYFVDTVTYIVNGFLETVYFIVERAPHLISILVALVIFLVFDVIAQREMVFAPARYGKKQTAPAKPSRATQGLTIVAIALWLLATWTFGPPVPYIGAVVWIASLVALLVMPQQRYDLLWQTKAFVVLYALAILLYRGMLWNTSRLSASQLSAVLNGVSTAQAAIASNVSYLTTVGSLALWLFVPLGFLSLLAKNWSAQPMHAFNPFANARDVMNALRSRSNPDE